MRTTIKDIARETGFSVSTVSLALGEKKHRLAEETVRKIKNAARELHYSPNQMAVGLITQKTWTMGLIVPDICNPFFAGIAKGAEEKCEEHHYNLILCNTNDNPEKDLKYMNVLLARGVDGVIFAMSADVRGDKAAECFRQVEQAQTPVILVDRALDEFPARGILINHELGGYLATRHLLDLGHRKIGCITGPMSLQSAKQRFFGYIRALQEFSVNFDPALVCEGDYHTASGYTLSQKLVERGVTAIFACNDMMAYGVFRRLNEVGISIPQSMSVVGFDDDDVSEIIQFPLTTVHQPVYEIGKTAAERLIRRIDAPDSVQEDIVFDPKLIIRKSTGPIGG